MKPINIFGRKISVVAVLIVALLIGTASAALITTYGGVSGTVEVPETFSIVGNDPSVDSYIPNLIIFTENSGNMEITNNIDSGVTANIVTSVYRGDAPEPNTQGVSIEYIVGGITIGTSNGAIDGSMSVVPITVPANDIVDVTVTFIPDAALDPGDYTIQIDVNPVV